MIYPMKVLRSSSLKKNYDLFSSDIFPQIDSPRTSCWIALKISFLIDFSDEIIFYENI